MSWKNRICKGVRIFFAVLIMFFILFPVFVTNGNSMLPTLRNRDILLGERFYNVVSYGDVIIALQYIAEDGSYHQVVKRVIGLPGDKVRIKDNQLYVNDVCVNEPYLYDKYILGEFEYTVPDDSIFVMGDNRNNSYDSRHTQCIPLKDIVSKVTFNLTKFERVE